MGSRQAELFDCKTLADGTLRIDSNNRPTEIGVHMATKQRKATSTTRRPYVIVRGRDSGVHAGELVSVKNKTVVLRNARRIWYWSGAASLSELAVYGASKPEECKFGARVDRQEILEDACELIHCHAAGRRMIERQPEWRA
jgi:hypothetical protein